ncbi:serine hydrolase domain-containing protein [Pelagicoccus sp. SDUM812003]|uniref:serine hydrolase domain-containing protein n=1 Tax=Pelagicoccus sp. SDUM812003 TaxID=3041267 RepID=UPI00280DE539|nr:serine hydrolase domain-containing protein [Pelagicoccus sp. SDUM812003]MDQ8204171.1 serine hydrolase [Pelagicoccus sp. SDUM812003]
MPFFSRSSLVRLGSIWLLVVCRGAGEELRTLDDALAAALQAKLEQGAAQGTFRGVSYSISIPGYRTWTGVYGDVGDAEATPVDAASVFGIASITKTYVAAIALQLRDEGRLQLDDLVSSYLGRIENVPETATLRHLLSMTSGVANFSDHPSSPIRVAVASPERRWSPREVLETYLLPPRFEPGERYSYSNTNFILLGMVVEEVTGQAFVETLRERLLEPLGLCSTYLGGFDALPDQLVMTDYNRDGRIEAEKDTAQASISSLFWTSGGMFTTSSDLVKWGRALYGGEVLSTSSLEQMVDFEAQGFGQYGLGAMPDARQGVSFWGHGGLLSYASSVGYAPDSGIAIGFIANMDRMFGSITYWPHDDMVGVLKEHGIEQSIEIQAHRIQFTNAPEVGVRLKMAKGVPPDLPRLEIVEGPASLVDGRVRTGEAPGQVVLRASFPTGPFYRGESQRFEFEVYSRFGDEDGDGVANAMEALLGSDLFDAGQRGELGLSIVDERFQLALFRSQSEVPYVLEHSTDLRSWERLDWQPSTLDGEAFPYFLRSPSPIAPEESVFLRLGLLGETED